MATAASLLAIVRASTPEFRSASDRLAFGVHSAVLSYGFRLAGVGDSAALEGAPRDAPEVPSTNWNAAADQYSFLYQSDTVLELQLLLKALLLGESLLITLASSYETVLPQTFELPISQYTTSDISTISKSYQNLDDLCNKVNIAIAAMEPHKKPKTAAAAEAAATTASEAAAASREAEASVRADRRAPPAFLQDPDADPLRIGPPRRPMPLPLGEDDIVPLRPPGGLEGPGGSLMPGMGPGGGMHVGPGHPFFGDRLRHPQGQPGGVPGSRWDPIAPEGLEGFHPEDLQRGGRRGPRGGRPGPPGTHPDISPPGPGRGTDWDSMFG